MTSNAKVPVMYGGAKEHMMDLVRKYAAPLDLYVGILLLLGCTYVKQIPIGFRAHADSLLGRLTLFLLVVLVADLYSWPYGLLMALFAVLLLSVAPGSRASEGFQSGKDEDEEVNIVAGKEKWFIEKVLNENPIAIEKEKVRTQAIQDNTTGSNSTTSSR